MIHHVSFVSQTFSCSFTHAGIFIHFQANVIDWSHFSLSDSLVLKVSAWMIWEWKGFRALVSKFSSYLWELFGWFTALLAVKNQKLDLRSVNSCCGSGVDYECDYENMCMSARKSSAFLSQSGFSAKGWMNLFLKCRWKLSLIEEKCVLETCHHAEIRPQPLR